MCHGVADDFWILEHFDDDMIGFGFCVRIFILENFCDFSHIFCGIYGVKFSTKNGDFLLDLNPDSL